MQDDALGPVVYDQLAFYDFPDEVDVFDLGCLSLDRISDVDTYDCIICVDALDGTGEATGTLFRFSPHEMAASTFGNQSLHDLKLGDLFAQAALLGFECEGVCFGMQVACIVPADVRVGLSPVVEGKVADLVDCVLAELVKRNVEIKVRATGEAVLPGFHHTFVKQDII